MNRKILLKFIGCCLMYLLPFCNAWAQTDQYTAQVTFPGGFQVGNYIEFLRVAPISAGASGYYEISITYTRSSVASAATYLASITHSNPNIWREAGRINSNGYVTPGSLNHNFTIDCNTQYENPRFRIRAINTIGVLTNPIEVFIKVRSINYNASWVPLNVAGNEQAALGFLPMTNDWSLYVGNTFEAGGASLAIKATENGNVGIGTGTPTEKLSVKGTIRAREIKVDNANWPDYVFRSSYRLPSLASTEKHIKATGHLPGIPSAAQVSRDGVSVGDMNARLLRKVEEITLHLIRQNKALELQNKQLNIQQREIKSLKKTVFTLQQTKKI